MALYWPKEKVALDIVDDPYRRPFEGDDSYTVLRVTCADLCNYDSYRKVMDHLCELLGKETPSMPGWELDHQELHSVLFQGMMGEDIDEEPFPFPDFGDLETLSDIEILATNESEGEFMSTVAQKCGKHVRSVSVWNGPIPDGSFETISDNTRMSTPEYFFLRKANQLPFPEAVALGIELCGKYRTSLTQYNHDDDTYDFIRSPRTTKESLRYYLHDIRNTKEGKRAKRVLRYVADECTSPMSCYLYLLLCLPRNRGSYALGRAQPSPAYRTEDGFMPSASGDYLAYDLCWPKKLVAVQYIGNRLLTEHNYEALATCGMRVVCVSDKDIADPERFDRIARKVAGHLGIEVPEPRDSWVAARNKLRNIVKPPAYDHMLLTMHDISKHKDW